MNWLTGNRYRLLLFSLVSIVLLTPLLRATAITHIILEVLTSMAFVIALWAVFDTRRMRIVALCFGVPTLIGFWTGFLIPGVPKVPLAIGFHSVASLFFSFSIGAILRTLYRAQSITADTIYGAFCGYLMAGIVFGNLYSLIELTQPCSFLGDALKGRGQEDHHFLLTYYSFLTLTTVGYGDIVPSSDMARGLAVVEAIFGQFYIAVLVAELIGKRAGQTKEPTSVPSNSTEKSS